MIDGTLKGKSIKGKITKIPQIDKTLSLADQAAEAKATGEALDKKVDKTSIADDLTTADASKVLSANQGVELKKLIATEAQNRKNAINELTNVTIKDINDKIADANDDIDDLGNNLTAAEKNIAKNQQDIEEINKKITTGFTYVGDGEAYYAWPISDAGRKIDTGLDCKAIMITGGEYMVIVTNGNSMAASSYNNQKPRVSKVVVNAAASFVNGVLTISPDSEDDGDSVSYLCNNILNKDGVEYTCIPL